MLLAVEEVICTRFPECLPMPSLHAFRAGLSTAFRQSLDTVQNHPPAAITTARGHFYYSKTRHYLFALFSS
jgi:hypothetical protein